jgi:acetyl esterase/lipase
VTLTAVAEPPHQVVVDEDGTVHIPAFSIPPSSYMSEQAKKNLINGAHERAENTLGSSPSIDELRAWFDNKIQKKVEHLEATYPVNIERHQIAGVRADVVTPREGLPRRHENQVLINLHGGAFQIGAVWWALAESIPVSSIGKYKVVTVDYRMAPEYHFPAASEDVASVYSALLKQYRPENIGIYGCSAGGSLSAMEVAWLEKKGAPIPGAIGILSAAAFAGFSSTPSDPGSWGGDSRFVTPLLVGEQLQVDAIPYLNNVDLSDPLVSPATSSQVLSHFPPTLLITGTRAYDMSAAVETQRRLTKAGVEAELHLWDGMGHCFFVYDDVPESREAFDVIADFFDRRLGRHK